ncbi:MAG: hydantoinase/oxoprolinase family protein, partial [Vicinamibacterales bacterium]
LTLMAFGGSGPVHACDLARTLGITRVLFPPSPGVFTAMGMLAGEVEHHELRPVLVPLAGLDAALVGTLLAAMRAAATRALVMQGYAAETIRFGDEIDLRLDGQDAALSIPYAEFDIAALRPTFIAAYRDTYGYTPSDAVEAVALRLHAHARRSAPLDFRTLVAAPVATVTAAASRLVHFGRNEAVETRVVRRETMSSRLSGPVIIEGADTTIVIPPGVRIEPNATGSLVATLEAA